MNEFENGRPDNPELDVSQPEAQREAEPAVPTATPPGEGAESAESAGAEVKPTPEKQLWDEFIKSTAQTETSEPASAGAPKKQPWDEILESAGLLKESDFGGEGAEADNSAAARLDQALHEIQSEEERSKQESLKKNLYDSKNELPKGFLMQAPENPFQQKQEERRIPLARYGQNPEQIPARDTSRPAQPAAPQSAPPPYGTGTFTPPAPPIPPGAPAGYSPSYPESPYLSAPRTGSPAPGASAVRPVKKKRNTGLAVFCILLSVLLVATLCLTVGYYMGKDGEPPAAQNSGGSLLPPVPPSDGPSLPDHSSEDLLPPPSGNIGGDVDVPIVDKPVGTAALSAAQAAEKVNASVVGIAVYSMDDSSGSAATGVIISSDGYILTNDHIYTGITNPRFIIVFSDGTTMDAEYVAGDARSDLAVLKVEATGLRPAEFGNSAQLEIGESVIAIGNPGGLSLAGTVTMGIVSGIDRRVSSEAGAYSMKCIQTDTAINPGNSGGPLINLYGQVVGINSSKIISSGYEGIGFSIPSVTAKNVLDSLVGYGYVRDRARLGITYTAVDIVSARQNDMPSGLYIESVGEDSDLSGKAVNGEIITHINGVEIVGGGEVLDIIESSKPGDEITLTVYSQDLRQSREVDVKLIEDRGESSYNKPAESQLPSLPENPDGQPNPFEDFEDFLP
ncbi:MAG TPA: hypothetical protein DEQ02_01485 [Ruminococcaceae bacterium]|nr:hypothetical protein [Oscillospiraceae bacterium]